MDLLKLINDYLIFLEKDRGVSRYTLKNYRHYLNNFEEFSKGKKVTRPEQLNLELINSYKIHLSKTFKRSTQNYFLIALRNFVWFLNDHKGFGALSGSDITLSKHPSPTPKTLDKELLLKLLNAPDLNEKDGLRDRTILQLLTFTGLKISELSSLNRQSIDFARGAINVQGKKERIIDMPSEIIDTLNLYLSTRKDHFNPLFIRFKGDTDPSNGGEAMRLTDRSIERMVKKYSLMLSNQEITPQILRHSFAKNLLDQGEKLIVVQKVLGHSHAASTKVYLLKSKIQDTSN